MTKVTIKINNDKQKLVIYSWGVTGNDKDNIVEIASPDIGVTDPGLSVDIESLPKLIDTLMFVHNMETRLSTNGTHKRQKEDALA